jgi:GDPmannose 4,6-dehydratase
MSGKTALITGALGQDGRLLSEWLVAQGYRVVGIVREAAQARAGAAAARADAPEARSSAPQLRPSLQGAVELITANLSDPAAVRQLLDRYQPDEIYHLAAYHHSSQEGPAGTQPEARRRMLETNFNITQTLAFAMLEAGSKSSLVFAGSSQMYTARGAQDRIDESTPYRPSTFYGHVKSWSAALLAQLRTDFGLRASTAILFNHESQLRRAQFVSRKITHAAAAARAGAAIDLEIGNIRSRVDWCSAADVVRALHLMATATVANDYVIASGTLHSVEDLLQTAFSHCGLDWRNYAQVQAARAAPALCGNPRLIETTLGWRRLVSFEQLIREMVEHDLQLAGRALHY